MTYLVNIVLAHALSQHEGATRVAASIQTQVVLLQIPVPDQVLPRHAAPAEGEEEEEEEEEEKKANRQETNTNRILDDTRP